MITKKVSKFQIYNIDSKNCLVDYAQKLNILQSFVGMIIRNNMSNTDENARILGEEIYGNKTEEGRTFWQYVTKDKNGLHVWRRMTSEKVKCTLALTNLHIKGSTSSEVEISIPKGMLSSIDLEADAGYLLPTWKVTCTGMVESFSYNKGTIYIKANDTCGVEAKGLRIIKPIVSFTSTSSTITYQVDGKIFTNLDWATITSNKKDNGWNFVEDCGRCSTNEVLPDHYEDVDGSVHKWPDGGTVSSDRLANSGVTMKYLTHPYYGTASWYATFAYIITIKNEDLYGERLVLSKGSDVIYGYKWTDARSNWATVERDSSGTAHTYTYTRQNQVRWWEHTIGEWNNNITFEGANYKLANSTYTGKDTAEYWEIEQ